MNPTCEHTGRIFYLFDNWNWTFFIRTCHPERAERVEGSWQYDNIFG